MTNQERNLVLLSFYRIGLGALPPSSDPKVTKVRRCVGKVGFIGFFLLFLLVLFFLWHYFNEHFIEKLLLKRSPPQNADLVSQRIDLFTVFDAILFGGGTMYKEKREFNV